MKASLCFTTLFALCSVLAGCASSFAERHYFKSVDSVDRPVNYYRLKVGGRTALSSSRYLSGYFDEGAVDAYFSEVTQPKAAKFTGAGESAGGVQPLVGGNDGKSLVLLLSSNSDVIAEQLGQFAENQQMIEALARLFNRERIERANEAIVGAKLQADRAGVLISLGDQLIAPLNASNKNQVEIALLQYANALAVELGNSTPFQSLDEAHSWLTFNRTRILGD